jgi:hypothetical protein
MKANLPFIIFLLLVLFSCTPNKTTQSTRPASTNTQYATIPSKRSATYRTARPKTIDTAGIPAFTNMRIAGWRIQLRPIDNKNQMLATRTTLLTSFSQHKIYTIYHNPFYKMRVGNFKSKADAIKVKTKIQTKLPGETFYIVQDTIEYRMPKAELIAIKMKQLQ